MPALRLNPCRGSTRRRLTGLVALAAVALILSGTRGGAQDAPQGTAPFTREVEEFVDIYLKTGGDKLTNWVQGDRVSTPEGASRAFGTPAGFTMELVAAEPVIRQPIDLHFDDRGRLWVVQYLQYPFPAGLQITAYDQYLRARYTGVPAPPPRHVRGADKITVLEDTDRDGVFDSHKDVITGLNITTSVLTGGGGVWVMNPPYLLFYRDATGDGLPDGDPEVRLEGFGLEDTHSLANSLTWGPDGWLYGVHGSTSTARVRGISFLGQAVWRYHPEMDAFELFAEGGGNPWTLSFDSRGRAFSGDNGGNSRGFHWVEGGRYVKNFPKHGPFTRPHSYGHIPNMTHSGDPARFAMTSVVYEDGQLPGYEGQLISGMALTSRVQATHLVPHGSTFRTVDSNVLVTTPDRSFRPVDTAVGPDGAVYFADWCDIRMDHTDPRDTWDKSCGRVWRLRARTSGPAAPVDLWKRTDAQLVSTLRDSRKWYRDHARRLLGERGSRSLVPGLRAVVRAERGQPALEALWAAHLISGIDGGWARELLDHPDAPVRAWTVRLLKPEHLTSQAVRERVIRLARAETDPAVRSALAGLARHLRAGDALPVLEELVGHGEDLSDPHIPLRLWWALERHATTDADVVLNWVEEARPWGAPLFAEHVAGRLARRLAAERGDRPAFRRIDPDTDRKAYALHPRVRMPGGKGDYTDWETNYTRDVSDRNLARLARLLAMAPPALQDRLLAGVQAGLGQGGAFKDVPTGPSDPELGQEGFVTSCAPCHQTDGSGMARLGAPLRNSPWVLGDEDRLVRIVLNGLRGDLLMPALGTLDDRQIAAILTYVRSAWGHQAPPVAPETVSRVRAASARRQGPWTREELSRLGMPD